jgi:hypothetical protein
MHPQHVETITESQKTSETQADTEPAATPVMASAIHELVETVVLGYGTCIIVCELKML